MDNYNFSQHDSLKGVLYLRYSRESGRPENTAVGQLDAELGFGGGLLGNWEMLKLILSLEWWMFC